MKTRDMKDVGRWVKTHLTFRRQTVAGRFAILPFASGEGIFARKKPNQNNPHVSLLPKIPPPEAQLSANVPVGAMRTKVRWVSTHRSLRRVVS